MPDQNSAFTGVTIDPSSVTPLPSAAPQQNAGPVTPPVPGVTIDSSTVVPLGSQDQPTPAFSLRKMVGPQTATGAPLTPGQSQEVSGVSDVFHGNIRQGLGKIWDSERPHVIPGSPIEKLIQKVNPDFHGAATPEYQAANEPAINKPLVDTAQFI